MKIDGMITPVNRSDPNLAVIGQWSVVNCQWEVVIFDVTNKNYLVRINIRECNDIFQDNNSNR